MKEREVEGGRENNSFVVLDLDWSIRVYFVSSSSTQDRDSLQGDWVPAVPCTKTPFISPVQSESSAFTGLSRSAASVLKTQSCTVKKHPWDSSRHLISPDISLVH